MSDSLTNSAATCWRDCRRRYYYRHERQLVPTRLAKSHALRFGTLLHAGLAEWFSTRDLVRVERLLQSLCVQQDEESLIAYHTARLMIEGYVMRWLDDDAQIWFCLPEQDFEIPLSNPDSGRSSRRFTFRGKLDLPALYLDGTCRVVEHKTARTLNGDYLARLWTDSQITGYVAAMRALGVDVSEVIYDVVIKSGIKRGADETMENYARRLGELYVGGYSAGKARRRKAETDDEWWARRKAEGEPVSMFHRETVIIGDLQIREWMADLWDVTQEILWARQHDRWPRNTNRCYDWGRSCDYVPICQSLGGEEMIIATEYTQGEPHPELDGQDETPF